MKKYNYLILCMIIFIILYIFIFFKLPVQEGLINKPKIAFCIVGQVRGNSCVSDYNKDQYIKDFWDEYIFNDELEKNYDYDVFISCDEKININKTRQYFGEHLKNIHIIDDAGNDTGYYLKHVKKKTLNMNKLLENISVENNEKYIKYIPQYYKLYDCYNLLNNYININDYNYIVKLRFDILFKYNIIDMLNYLNNNKNVQIYMNWDMVAIGKPKIMEHYLNLFKSYYNYDITKQKHNMEKGITGSKELYYTLDDKYKPEIILYEHIYKYCNDNKLIIDNIIKKIPLKEICFVSNFNRTCDGDCIRKNDNMVCWSENKIWR